MEFGFSSLFVVRFCHEKTLSSLFGKPRCTNYSGPFRAWRYLPSLQATKAKEMKSSATIDSEDWTPLPVASPPSQATQRKKKLLTWSGEVKSTETCGTTVQYRPICSLSLENGAAQRLTNEAQSLTVTHHAKSKKTWAPSPSFQSERAQCLTNEAPSSTSPRFHIPSFRAVTKGRDVHPPTLGCARTG